MIVWSAIDPGCIHFSISILNNKINLDVNFKNFRNYFKFLEEFLNNLINYIVATFNIKEDKLILKIIIEKQIPQKFNKNLKLEYFLAKILKNISKTRNDLIIHYYFCPAYFKNRICLEKYKLKYIKIKSRKQFKSLSSNEVFYSSLLKWKLFLVDLNIQSVVQQSKTEKINDFFPNFLINRVFELLKLRKFDDFVDTKLLLDSKELSNFRYIKQENN